MKQQKGWQWQRKLFIRNGQANFITNLKLFQNFAEQMIKQVVFALIIPVQETFYVYHEGTGTKGLMKLYHFYYIILTKIHNSKILNNFTFFLMHVLLRTRIIPQLDCFPHQFQPIDSKRLNNIIPHGDIHFYRVIEIFPFLK